MNIGIKKIIEDKHGKISEMNPEKKTRVFVEVYNELAIELNRDFNYALQVVESKKEDAIS